MSEPRSLVKKIAEVMTAVGGVPKRGFNKHFNYSYAKETDILDAVRGELAKRHCILVPSVESYDIRDVPTKDGTSRLTSVLMKFTAMDGETGETFSFGMLGQGQDPGDKGSYKAETGAEKYAVKKLFMLGDEEADPEADAQTDESHAKPSKPPEPLPPPKPTAEDLKLLVDSFAPLGVTQADLEKILGWPLATASGADMIRLRKVYAEKRAAVKNPDEAARQQVQRQAEEALAKTEKPSRAALDAAFKTYVENIRVAATQVEVMRLVSEAAGKFGKPEIASLNREAKTRQGQLDEAKARAAMPKDTSPDVQW